MFTHSNKDKSSRHIDAAKRSVAERTRTPWSGSLLLRGRVGSAITISDPCGIRSVPSRGSVGSEISIFGRLMLSGPDASVTTDASEALSFPVSRGQNPTTLKSETQQMKRFSLLLLFCLTAVIAGLAQLTPAPKQILHDFRTDNRPNAPKITPAVQRSVLTKVFRKYLTDDSKCNPNFAGTGTDDFLKAARNGGQIVPTIVDSTTGSFTATGQTQTLYVIAVNECGASHADNYGSKRIAIMAGPQLVTNVDSDFKSSIVRKIDLDGDGIDEVLMTSGDMSQGTLTEMAALLSFQNGKLKVIEDFGTVVLDSCASGFPGSSAKASVISHAGVFQGTIPKLKMDNYESSCRNTKRWKFISTGKMPE